MAEVVYILCGLASVACALMLFRGYRISRSQLLLWSCVCFSLLAANNIFLFVDMIILPELDMSGPLWRNFLSASAGSLLLYGLIWEMT